MPLLTLASLECLSACSRLFRVFDNPGPYAHAEAGALVVEWAKEAGLSTSVDLMYGTPGESLADWETSVRAALSYDPDHISAYALVVEEGTKMGAQVARGELPTPDPDDEAAKYELVDELLGEAGYAWYEISNFARASASDRASGRPRRRLSTRRAIPRVLA